MTHRDATTTDTRHVISARADAFMVVPIITDAMKVAGFKVTSRGGEAPIQLRHGSLLKHFVAVTLVDLVSGGGAGGDTTTDAVIHAQIRVVDERSGRTTVALDHLQAPATGIDDEDPVWKGAIAAVVSALEAHGVAAHVVTDPSAGGN
ncbi:hypothetical protein [Demequina globuliformis]|uniref:hypothetical protein n=1 Tax=Demequina globuliformis TaxID=676202 RepID=UPI000780EB1B|nr:hypothetical protein [Demequina globuliformis]